MVAPTVDVNADVDQKRSSLFMRVRLDCLLAGSLFCCVDVDVHVSGFFQWALIC